MPKQIRTLSDYNKVNQLKIEIEKRKIPIEDKVAYIGLFLIQLALLPSHFSTTLPHYSLPLMVFLGLICYQYRAFILKLNIYVKILSVIKKHYLFVVFLIIFCSFFSLHIGALLKDFWFSLEICEIYGI